MNIFGLGKNRKNKKGKLHHPEHHPYPDPSGTLLNSNVQGVSTIPATTMPIIAGGTVFTDSGIPTTTPIINQGLGGATNLNSGCGMMTTQPLICSSGTTCSEPGIPLSGATTYMQGGSSYGTTLGTTTFETTQSIPGQTIFPGQTILPGQTIIPGQTTILPNQMNL
jgi:hypothetical protein